MNKWNMSVIAMLLICVACCMSCDKQEDKRSNEIELTVASKRVISTDWGGMQAERNVVCEAGGKWQVLYSIISGFQYEDGYEYKLKVRKITPAPDVMDAYTSYELISQLAKEKKATVFARSAYYISNQAKVTGKKLSADDIASIENQIKSLSPFNGVNELILEYTDFHIGIPPLSKDYIYRTNTGKSGHCNQTFKEEGGICTFNFDGKSVSYEYSSASPEKSSYMLLDVTTEYKTQYPDIESAQSAIRINMIR